MSRQELADAVNAHLYAQTGQVYRMDANHVGKLEQGVICWPAAPIRAGLRAVLGVTTDRDLGLHSTRQPPVTRPAAAPPEPFQPGAIDIVPLVTGVPSPPGPRTVIGLPSTSVSLTVTTDPTGTVRITIETAPPPEVAAPSGQAETEAGGGEVVLFERPRRAPRLSAQHNLESGVGSPAGA